MNLIIRQRGSRRLDLPVEFPLMDSQGLFVIKDRRRLTDRRKAECGIDDLKVILSKMARNQTGFTDLLSYGGLRVAVFDCAV